jgi:hypothetical protein
MKRASAPQMATKTAPTTMPTPMAAPVESEEDDEELDGTELSGPPAGGAEPAGVDEDVELVDD